MATFAFRLPCALCALSWLAACAPIAAMVGYSGSAMQVAATLDRVKLASDGVSYLGSGKTITDHAVSMVAGADCHLLNVISPDPVCRPAQDTSAGNTNPRAPTTAAADDAPGSDAPAIADSPYALDGKVLAGYGPGSNDTGLDP
jgi:hypothetical protein